jgi:hypothetical protein
MKYFISSNFKVMNLSSIKYNKLMLMAALSIFFMPSLSLASDEMPQHCPIIEKAFTYGSSNSNQITWQTLPFMDETFLRETGGADQDTKLKRAVGSVELLLLIRYSLQGGNIQESDSAKITQAQDEMGKELKKSNKGPLLSDYLSKGIIPMDTLVEILNRVKGDINTSEKSSKSKCTVM